MNMAKSILGREHMKFLDAKKVQHRQVCKEQKKIIFNVPEGVISGHIKKEFVHRRDELMRRTYFTEGSCKVVSDWTMPKMLKIAKEEQKSIRQKIR